MAELKDTKINGELSINGELIVDDIDAKEKLKLIDELNNKINNIFNSEQFTTNIVPGEKFSTVTGQVTRVGNILIVFVNATPSVEISPGSSMDITNTIVGTYTVQTNGKIIGDVGASSPVAPTGSIGALMIMDDTIKDGVLTFNIKLTAIAEPVKDRFTAYFTVPVHLNLNKF